MGSAADSVTQCNNQALHIAEFGEDKRPGIANVVGVKNVKDVAAAIKVTNCRDVLRPRLAELGATRRRDCALALHDIDFPEYFLLHDANQNRAIAKYRESYRFMPGEKIQPAKHCPA